MLNCHHNIYEQSDRALRSRDLSETIYKVIMKQHENGRKSKENGWKNSLSFQYGKNILFGSESTPVDQIEFKNDTTVLYGMNEVIVGNKIKKRGQKIGKSPLIQVKKFKNN